MRYLFFLLLIVQHALGQTLSKVSEDAWQYYEQKKYDEAITLLDKGIERYRDNATAEEMMHAMLLKGRNYTHKWDKVNAKHTYLKAWEFGKDKVNDSILFQAGLSFISISATEGELDSTLIILRELQELDDLDSTSISDLNTQISYCFQDREQIDSAIYYAAKAVAIDRQLHDSSSAPFSHMELGTYYSIKGQYQEAIDTMIKGMEYLRGKRDDFKKYTMLYRLGQIYFQAGNLIKAENLNKEALAYAQSANLQVLQTRANQMLGDCAFYENDFIKALTYYETADSVNNSKSKHIYRGAIAKASALLTRLELGEKIGKSEIDEVLDYVKDSDDLATATRINLLRLKVLPYSLAEFERDYANYYQLANADQTLTTQRSFLNAKKSFYSKKGMYDNVYKIDQKIDDVNKKINSQYNKYLVSELEAKYVKKQQDQEIVMLNEQNEHKENILYQQRKTIWIGGLALGLISILSMVLFRLFRKVSEQRKTISKALSEKDLLLREIHHRVKNNLQLVSSLLTLQGHSIDDEMAIQAINEGKSRVRSMALIHQDLYNKENLTDIGVQEYMQKLVAELFQTYRIDNDSIQLHLDIQDIDLDIDTLIPVGLITNELITNCLKYAWPDHQKGVLQIKLKTNKNKAHLLVKDDGVGYDSDKVRENSFGSTLIAALTEQLDGELHQRNEKGTEVSLVFPLTNA